MVERLSGICGACDEPASIFHTDKDANVEMAWCLDHAPERYADDVAHCRASDEFITRWDAWLNKREEAGEVIPSWRVAASSAFTAGIEFAKKYYKL